MADEKTDQKTDDKKRRGCRQKVVAGGHRGGWRRAALFLAVGALLIALKANQDNAIVSFVLDVADRLDLGVFSREQGIFTFDGKNAETKNALVNWGIGAIAYLVAGKVLDRIIRP